MYRCLEIILLIFLVRAAKLEAKVTQADQVSKFVNKNVRTISDYFSKLMFEFFETKMKFCK